MWRRRYCLTQGRIAGISGITGSLFRSEVGDKGWRWAFFLGLMAGGGVLAVVSPEVFVVSEDRPIWMMGLAGLLVGVGTQMGNGCTSGHGVCELLDCLRVLCCHRGVYDRRNVN